MKARRSTKKSQLPVVGTEVRPIDGLYPSLVEKGKFKGKIVSVDTSGAVVEYKVPVVVSTCPVCGNSTSFSDDLITGERTCLRQECRTAFGFRSITTIVQLSALESFADYTERTEREAWQKALVKKKTLVNEVGADLQSHLDLGKGRGWV